jgi:hypothetical protein
MPTPTAMPTPTPVSTTTPTVLTPASGGSVTDGSGNSWTLSSAGETVENGTPIATGSGTSELTAVNGVIWGQAAAGGGWYTYANGYWTPQGSATPPASATSNFAATPATSVITVPSGQSDATVAVNNATINATGGDHLFFISGNNNTFNLGGGTETITDSGSGNTFNLPAAGNGSLIANAAVLSNGDTFNLATALEATSWDGSASSLGSYLHTEQVGGNTALLVSDSASNSASGTVLATFGQANVSLATILAHSLT